MRKLWSIFEIKDAIYPMDKIISFHIEFNNFNSSILVEASGFNNPVSNFL